jgi:hypothetical protein
MQTSVGKITIVLIFEISECKHGEPAATIGFAISQQYAQVAMNRDRYIREPAGS